MDGHTNEQRKFFWVSQKFVPFEAVTETVRQRVACVKLILNPTIIKERKWPYWGFARVL